jgi:hypothetical protein
MTLCDKLASIEDDDISIEGEDVIDSLAFLSKFFLNHRRECRLLSWKRH